MTTPEAKEGKMKGDGTDWTHAWLAGLCSTDNQRPKLKSPWRYGGRIMASDGHVLGAVPDDGREVGNPGFDNMELVLAPLNREAGLDAVTLDLAVLREWCGDINPCPKCNGRSVVEGGCLDCGGDGFVECECLDCGHEHTAACATCDETGNFLRECEACGQQGGRKAQLGPATFKVSLLQRMIRGVPGESVRLCATNESTAIVVRGDGWEGLIMPVINPNGAYGDSVESLPVMNDS